MECAGITQPRKHSLDFERTDHASPEGFFQKTNGPQFTLRAVRWTGWD